MALTPSSTKRRPDVSGDAIKVVTATGETALIQVVALADEDGSPAGTLANPFRVQDVAGGMASDAYISEFARPDNDGVSSPQATGDYRDAPDGQGLTNFEFGPPAGEVWDVTRMIVYIQDDGVLDATDYGNNTALTEGIAVRVVRKADDEVRSQITGFKPVTSNAEWAQYSSVVNVYTFGSSDQAISATIDFTVAGNPRGIRLDGDQNEVIRISLNDDLSDLAQHTFLFKGQRA